MKKKGRDIFVFLLSSEDQIKARIALTLKSKVKEFEEEIAFKRYIDDVVVKRESEIVNSELLDRLKKRIEEKVSSHMGYSENGWFPTTTDEQTKIIEEPLFTSKTTKNRIHISIENHFAGWVLSCGFASDELKTPNKIKKRKERVIWKYDILNENKVGKVEEMLMEEISGLASEYLLEISEEEEIEEGVKEYSRSQHSGLTGY